MAADESKYPLGPFKLVTVNNAPERAKRLIGRVVEEVKGRYTIVHAGNADSEFCYILFYQKEKKGERERVEEVRGH